MKTFIVEFNDGGETCKREVEANSPEDAALTLVKSEETGDESYEVLVTLATKTKRKQWSVTVEVEREPQYYCYASLLYSGMEK